MSITVSYLYAKKKRPSYYKRYDQIQCPVCKRFRCYDHCNNCGISIDIKYDEYLGKYVCYLDGTDTPHNDCMKDGTVDGKYKDVNLKREQDAYLAKWFDTGNFFNLCVVQESDSQMLKDEKIANYKKKTKYTRNG